jgi:hypothetical protein
MSDQAKPDKKTEDWMQKKWRPMMAMMYMTVCAFDFIVFPVMFTIVQFWETQAANDAFRQWNPLTLQGAGLFHMAMGAVLGITAWSRGQEKMAGVTSGSSATDAPAMPKPSLGSAPLGGNTVSTAPAPMPAADPAPTVPPVAKPASMDFGIK